VKIQILGTRGIPAQHGGFETFTEHFAIYLQQKGWQVTVYCQENTEREIYEDEWCGIHRVHIPVSQIGAKGTVIFDWKSTLHATQRKVPVLTLGYNTAIFCVFYRMKGIKNVINMDGVEWRRGKWSPIERAWLYINEKLGAWFGNHLIADHPEIMNHLSHFVSRNKITVIPYSADLLDTADAGILNRYGIEPYKYSILIARPEPENSILEIVRAYSRKKRGFPLVILGNYSPDQSEYQRQVMNAAAEEIKFVGALYEKHLVQALRFYARLYIHGHTVGGTNPSLVEALGAGSPVLSHDNKFNRWVAGEGAHFFLSEESCAAKLDILLNNDEELHSMREHSRNQILKNFTWDRVHTAYEELLLRFQ
jgi:glycosyltransferase involved in cell wall biosynthesis